MNLNGNRKIHLELEYLEEHMLQHGIDELECWKDRKNDMNLSINNENNKILEKKQ
jgi:hypothetical protein